MDPALLGGLAAGTRCTVTQVLDGDTATILTATTGVPADPVEIVADQTATVAVIDTYTQDAIPPPTTGPPSTPPTAPPIPRTTRPPPPTTKTRPRPSTPFTPRTPTA